MTEDKCLKERVRDIFKKEVFNREIIGDEDVKILVLDTHTTTIISSLFRSSEIFDFGVGITDVARLGGDYNPNPFYSAIYYITPSENSIKNMIDDFEEPKDSQQNQFKSNEEESEVESRKSLTNNTVSTPQVKKFSTFKKAYVFFSKKVSEKGMECLGESSMMKNSQVKVFREVNINFSVVDEDCFSFGMPNDLSLLYAAQESLRMKFFGLIVDQLVFFLLSLGFFPVIRYPRHSKMAKMLAYRLFDSFFEFYDSYDNKKRLKKVEFLICERNEDFFVPFLHDFTYFPMLFDVLDVKSNGIYIEKIESTTKSKKKSLNLFKKTLEKTKKSQKEEEKKVIILGSDYFWNKFKFMHLNDIQETLKNDISLFRKETEEESEINKERSEEILKENNEGENNVASNKKIKDKIIEVFTKYPVIKRKTYAFNLHSKLVLKLISSVKNEETFKVSEAEQMISTGRHSNQTESTQKDCRKAVIDCLKNESIPLKAKLRLVLIYLVRFGGYKNIKTNENEENEEKKEGKEDKKIKDEEKSKNEPQVINNMEDVKVFIKILPSVDENDRKAIFEDWDKVFKNLDTILRNNEIVFKPQKKDLIATPFECSRYVSKINQIVTKFVNKDKTSNEEYPIVGKEFQKYLKTPPWEIIGLENSFLKAIGKDNERKSLKNEKKKENKLTSFLNIFKKKEKKVQRSFFDDEDFNSKKAETKETEIDDENCVERSLVVFVIGGLTFAEAREAEKLKKDQGIHCFFGSTDISNPRSYMRKIFNLEENL